MPRPAGALPRVHGSPQIVIIAALDAGRRNAFPALCRDATVFTESWPSERSLRFSAA